MTNSVRVWLAAGVVTLWLAGGLMWATPARSADAADGQPSQQAGGVADREDPARPVMVVTAQAPQLQQLPRQIPADGDLVAWQEASIASESSGLTLADVLVDVGDTVQKGQVLARFNGRTVAADVTQARAALAEAQANAAEARANAARARRLRNTDSLSRQQIDQYLAAERSALARVQAAQAALVARRQNWQSVELRAPDAGVISARMATVGAVPGAGTELFRLIRQGRLEWQAELAERARLQIKVGDRAEIHTADGQSVSARVRALAPMENTRTRTMLVYVDVPSHPGLWAGMFAHGAFLLDDSPGLTVPADALVPHDGFMYVYRLTPDNHVARVRVTVGRQQGARLEVMPVGAARLSEHDRIVVDGAAFLSDGDLVRVVPAVDTSDKEAS